MGLPHGAESKACTDTGTNKTLACVFKDMSAVLGLTRFGLTGFPRHVFITEKLFPGKKITFWLFFYNFHTSQSPSGAIVKLDVCKSSGVGSTQITLACTHFPVQKIPARSTGAHLQEDAFCMCLICKQKSGQSKGTKRGTPEAEIFTNA